jgi:hypothetical protein
VALACWECGATLEKKPGPGRNPRYCDDRCRYRFKNPPGSALRVKSHTRAPVEGGPGRGSMTTTESARVAALARWAGHEKVTPKPKPSRRVERACRFCGDIVPMTARQQSCGKAGCRRARNAERMREGGWPKARRAQRRTTEVEQFSPLDIFVRDQWVCGICTKSVDQALRWPDPMSASLDHIQPLSRGGSHLPENTRCSHLGCNVARGNRVA